MAEAFAQSLLPKYEHKIERMEKINNTEASIENWILTSTIYTYCQNFRNDWKCSVKILQSTRLFTKNERETWRIEKIKKHQSKRKFNINHLHILLRRTNVINVTDSPLHSDFKYIFP